MKNLIRGRIIIVNLKKVVKIGSTKTTNPNKEDQEKYEEKVKNMRAACKNFKEKFKEYLDIPKMWQGLLKCSFKEQMAKNRLVSRTSRILHDMSKKLSKFKNEFDPNKVAEYSKAFYFKAKKANSKDYIKRSAIDDEEVADFFNIEIPRILQGKAKEKKNALNEAVEKSKGLIDTANKKRRDSLGSKNKAANAVKGFNEAKEKSDSKEDQNEIKQQILAGKQDANNLESSMKELEKQQKVMVKASQALQQGIKKTSNENKINELMKPLKGAIENFDKSTEKLEAAIDDLQKSTDSINNAEEKGAFDEETGTFTIRSDDDFKEIKNHKGKIKAIIVEGNIKTIGDQAFFNCKALTSVDLGNVTTIGEQAFCSCTALESVVFGNNVKTIEKSAFAGCKALTSVDLKNVTTIRESAFDDCEKLEIVDLSKVTTIGDQAFYKCKKLEIVDLSKVKTIGKWAFRDCEILESVVFGENVNNIGELAFYSCETLESVVFRGSVDTIGGQAFSCCSSLKTVILPKDKEKAANVKEEMLKQIRKKEGIEFISDFEEAYSFDKGTGIFTIKTEDGFSGSIQYKTKIKKIIMEESIETVKNSAFKCCTALESVDLKNVTTIGEAAFDDCKALTSVDLSKVTTIGKLAFKNCEKLESVVLSNVKTIGGSAFGGCKALTSVDLSKVTTIEGGTFANCEALERVNLGNVTTIRTSAFKGCKKLKKIDLSNVTTIRKWAFNGCEALTSVVFGNNVTTIEESVFYNCTALTSVDLSNVTTIRRWAFRNCTSLTSVDLKNVTTIGELAFDGCSNLKTVTLPENEEKAKMVKEKILNQTGKNAGDGENGTIQFINDPEPAKQKK